MSSTTNEKIYDISLISKVKEQTGPKKLKKIIKNLRNFTEKDLKELSKLKIKIFEEDREEEEKSEFVIIAPIIKFQHYLEYIKKSNSKSIVNNNDEFKGEDTPFDAKNVEKEIKQKDSSDFSSDE